MSQLKEYKSSDDVLKYHMSDKEILYIRICIISFFIGLTIFFIVVYHIISKKAKKQYQIF